MKEPCYILQSMTTSIRYDQYEVGKWRRDARGFLRVKAAPTRTGIFVYRRADGTEVKELRPAEEVSSDDSLATLRGAPVTHLHPQEPVNPSNAKALGIGHVGDTIKMDGHLVDAEIVIEDESMIHAVEKGALVELSCGYSCSIDPTPGTYEGERYDQVQRNITYNHVALGPRNWGRAGSEVALRTDSDDAVLVNNERADTDTEAEQVQVQDSAQDVGSSEPIVNPNINEDKIEMIKLRLDGHSVEASEESAPVLEKLWSERADQHAAALKEVEGKLAEAVSRADKAEAERDDLQAKLDSVASDEAVQARVQARLGLERDAAVVLGSETKLDSLSDAEVRHEVLAKARPDFSIEGRSDDYVTALFEVAVADAKKRQDGGLNKLKETLETPRTDSVEPASNPFEKRRKAFILGE